MQKEYAVGANVGVVKGSATARTPTAVLTALRALERLLILAGEEAQAKGIGVLITCDEAHELNTPELAGLGRLMQMATRRRRLPVAIVLSGLPELRANLRAAGTYLERHELVSLGNLDADAARLALLNPAARR
ncbi:MAG: hypothetical protein ACRDZR_03470 [Acidimicrobiales bacterium]